MGPLPPAYIQWGVQKGLRRVWVVRCHDMVVLQYLGQPPAYTNRRGGGGGVRGLGVMIQCCCNLPCGLSV